MLCKDTEQQKLTGIKFADNHTFADKQTDAFVIRSKRNVKIITIWVNADQKSVNLVNLD